VNFANHLNSAAEELRILGCSPSQVLMRIAVDAEPLESPRTGFSCRANLAARLLCEDSAKICGDAASSRLLLAV
jgi:hypothetical protein